MHMRESADLVSTVYTLFAGINYNKPVTVAELLIYNRFPCHTTLDLPSIKKAVQESSSVSMDSKKH